ncbi:F-type H+-transporting ATPase subunit b [Paenibacillus anaericanus]|uniref:ATP synthase subunit b n=1 Tax=Paenibacillus anaericanus TaxID=170367 RepID=A0A433Y1Y0_9BACL|nr:F0F1 ATP synthase subunit B [Paenibacillus anaericanus]MDQ0089843.1 F-type H+-transporting ATPase subunit b [Paenibacillus anaericanus]RUT41742.1 ATP synthase F0 subunit B [Paenibacillus anaericanus]
MKILWENILITMIAFVILYWLLNKFAFSKLFAVMEQRRELVLGQLNEAKQTREQATVYVEEQKDALKQARQDAFEIIEQSKQSSSKQAHDLLEQAKLDALRMKNEAVRDIESERNKAVEALRTEIGTFSVNIASKLIEREVENNPAEQEKLVNQYLDEVGKKS